MEVERYRLIYKIDKSKTDLRLLGDKFFERNKGFGNFLYKNRRIKLQEIIAIDNIKEDELQLDLLFYKKIYNKSFIFKDCEKLLKIFIINDEDKTKYSQIKNMIEEEDFYLDY